MTTPLTVGVIGGSGLYEMEGLTDVREVHLATPFGEPSDAYFVGHLGDVQMVFLPRHGRGHRVLPSDINYRANLWGLRRLGVTQILSISAVGSLREGIVPGDFVVIDQFIDRTRHRPDTFFGDGVVAHVMFADPLCPSVRSALLESGRSVGVTVHDGGTYVNMEGPQFSTRAESELYRTWGANVIGMTNLQEAKLAREAEMCYATVAMATDYDCWHDGHDDVTVEAIVAVMNQNVGNAKSLIRAAVPHLDPDPPCHCREALQFAIMTAPDRIPNEARERLGLLIDKYLPAREWSRDLMDARPMLALTLGLTLFWGCAADPELPPDLVAALDAPVAESEEAETKHLGPTVAKGDAGPARFVGGLLQAFDAERAQAAIELVDRYYRAAGNDGYETVLDQIADELGEIGFGSEEAEGVLELRTIEGAITAPSWVRGERVEAPAWNPKKAQVALVGSDGERRVLHAFDREEARDRTVLPINAPSCDVQAPVAFHLDELEEGQILVLQAPLSRSLIRRAEAKGVVAALSASYESFNVDPTGAERHMDFIQYRNLYYPPELPVGQISPRSYEAIKAACADDPAAEVHFTAEVEFTERPLRTLVATIVGSEQPDECVAISSHVNEPGAGDNASGVVAMLEGARSLAAAIRTGRIERPARSIVFVWGDEFRMTEAWLAAGERQTIVGISADMLGQSKAQTGAIALVERMPDPGAVRPLEPDVHTPWGANPVDPEALRPNGLSIIARCAMIDVGLSVGGWDTADHPWEGGSDHDIYDAAGVPAILVWHFTDFSYHSSLDRLEMIDIDELERSAVAVLAIALAVADPDPGDLQRYLASNDIERNIRVDAALGDEDEALAQSWRDWSTGSRYWLRELCLGLAAEGR